MRKKGIGIIVSIAMLLSVCGCSIQVVPEGAPVDGTGSVTGIAQTEGTNGASETEPGATDVPGDAEGNADAQQGNGQTEAVDENADVLKVETFYDVEGHYVDNVDNAWDYRYRLPRFVGVDSQDVQDANRIIDGIYTNDVEACLRDAQEGYSLWISEVDYSLYEGSDLISVMVYVAYDYDWTQYYCFNFAKDGHILEGEELFEKLGVTGEELLADITDTFEKATNVEQYEEYDWYADNAEFLIQVHERTMAPDNCNLQIPFYLDTDGNICYIGNIYSVAGADSYNHIYHYNRHDLD